MSEERLALSELLEKAGDGDFLRIVAEAVLQLLMETDVDELAHHRVTVLFHDTPPLADDPQAQLLTQAMQIAVAFGRDLETGL